MKNAPLLDQERVELDFCLYEKDNCMIVKGRDETPIKGPKTCPYFIFGLVVMFPISH